MEHDQKFVEDVVKEIVDNPDKVKTDRRVDEMGVLIELTVDPSDMGKIIGKDGRTAKAVRTLLRVLGAKNNSRINLKIMEPEGSERPPRKDYSEEPEEEKKEVAEKKDEKSEDVMEDVPEDVLE
ncbi:hypothetical protein A2215_03830 [Candidatus Berkelbacteria bacterium RIFOXYA2_FULL_43_10]|uniref:RNA-binding protein KhpA n=1 Tax=Candidatus Berkelbacteria bacterium RIFOXYA2_FULL_43_10 TaxID=1797472 RepID=A0A1F5E7Z1_9BACT|nr:MAG: hypothetical protein A2215_03830 [Candidatus Berkelbacteria bacterium RIFOXYA2_FULL_43_10]